MKYRTNRKELFVIGKSFSEMNPIYSLKTYKLPDLELIIDMMDIKGINIYVIKYRITNLWQYILY